MIARAIGSGRVLSVRLDLAGAGLLLAAMAWLFVATALSGSGEPLPVAAMFALAGLGYAVTRAVARVRPWIPPLCVVVAAVVLMVAVGDVYTSRPLQGPFGYANAKSCFFALAATAAVMLVLEMPLLLKVPCAALAVAFGAVPFVAGAAAAGVPMVALVALALLAPARFARVVIVVTGLVALAAIVVTLALGASRSARDALPERIRSAVTEERLQLWHDAAAAMAGHPVAGVGSGNFRDASPLATSDRDFRWAHSEFLQQGAELGVLGFTLPVLLVAWVFLRLFEVRPPGRLAAVAAAAVAVATVQGSVDYVLRFPGVVLTASVLAATGVAAGARRETQP